MWPFRKKTVDPEVYRLHRAHAINVARELAATREKQEACPHTRTQVDQWDGAIICTDCDARGER